MASNRIEFARMLKMDYYRLESSWRGTINIEAEDFEAEWRGRFGDNDRVRQDGGPAPDLAKSTVRHKGHNRMLEETFELRDSIDRYPLGGGVAEDDDTGPYESDMWASVTTDHWLFPIHEYMLSAPPNWEGDLRRQTLAPTNDHRGFPFVNRLAMQLEQVVGRRAM